MPTTLTCWNQRSSFGRDTASHIAVMPLSPGFATVLIFSAVGLLASICLQLLLPASQETAFLLAQFG